MQEESMFVRSTKIENPIDVIVVGAGMSGLTVAKELMEWLDAKADWINQIAKTDCEDMQKLVGGIAIKDGSR